ncbi:hypothetical protein I203_104841 [Kwoniella mangroviensis CBS 8507]|uniref:uncharacterized protein n=1 Tax=Kwoniella mangroviensis CBS 8507 TaxID=1296122 RepID=UPI00080CFB67|nr:uncharacterized protein I203_00217 [Kwoniella mangroviensis CBS 8507]OCF70086.1 hypothetical protein I203_00217 [Kwoniella mangroviensis CBS 8507]
MPHLDSIQLGILSLGLSFRFPSSSEPRWTPLSIPFLESDALFDDPSAPLVQLLRLALSDVGLGFQGEWIRDGVKIKVRCWILPSDVPGSMWKSIHSKDRERVIKGLLSKASRYWDIGQSEAETILSIRPEDGQSMQEIYSSIPSPPDPHFKHSDSLSDRELFNSLNDYENPFGVKTDSYKYQIRSVAKMVQMEMQPERLVDPSFTPLQEAGRDATYYVNLSNWDIQRHPGWYDLPKGGILCEQMGTGKTLMCLSLITSTLYQPTLPPSNRIDLSPITTDVAERTYPFAANADLRALTGYPRSRTDLTFPSLLELCANVVATNDPSAKHQSDLPDILRPLLERRTFYCTLPVDDECSRYAKKKTYNQTVKKIHLAKGTLVIVPQILIHQWQAEIVHHLEEGALSVYNVEGKELPSIETLLEYDVILMDTLRFGAEETQHRVSKGMKPSVLIQARWKRIILDEGHTAQSKLTNSMTFARQLSVERRWLVSGTPTRHLQQGGEAELESIDVIHSPDVSRTTTPTANDVHVDGEALTVHRAWNQLELEDAYRIGRMIGGFLAAEPFKTEGGFERNVIAPLKNKEGPSFGAVRRMKYIMNSLMVKHAPHVIDIEAQLPPSTIINELLQFEPMQKMTYNVLAALVASNVYTSGGEDIDYFLHKDNREAFLQVVDNLHLACFWYSARDMGVKGCLDRTKSWLERHPEADQHVREQLEEACHHLQLALDSEGWSEWMTNGVSMPLDGQALPSLIKESWSDAFNSRPNMVDVHSFNILKQLNEKGKRVQDLHIVGWDHRNSKLEDFQKTMAKYMEKHAKEQKKLAKAKNSTAAKASKAVIKSSSSPVKNVSKKRKNTDMDEMDEWLQEAARNAALASNASIANLPRPLPDVIHTRSKSAKANFVARTILSADKDDKFVIFGDAYELGHLTEILDLLDITSTFVGSESFTRDRRKALDDFQKPEIRVCLLDLKVGARGLNLVIANRMIFLRPIWNLDVQAQAIKRVHRIGQRRPTKIQILVTEGTFEEDIAKRSSKNRSQDDEKLYSRAMIENPRFVYPEKVETETFAVRFIPTIEFLSATAVKGTNGNAMDRDGHDVMEHRPGSVVVHSDPGPATATYVKRETEDLGGIKKRARVMFA